ncbi:MAG TPA: TolC family protein [Longimicrobiaceae bacterium]|nr:TolC family protein [Longimicrobiaceae bacterium]
MYLVLAALLAAVPPQARATPPDTAPGAPLSRSEAVALALDHNPQLSAAREQVAEARAGVVQAVAIPDPTLGATLDEESGVFAPGAEATRALALGLTIPSPSRLVLRGRVARGDLHATQFGYTALRQQIAAQTVQSYDALLVARRHARDLDSARVVAQDFVRRTRARYQAGTAAKLDVVKATVDASQVENDRIAAERDIANARADLNRLLGRTPGAAVEPTDTLAVPPPLPGLAELGERARAARPELAAMRAERAGAHSATSLARQYWVPDLDLALTRTTGPDGAPTYTTDFGIGLPLFFWQHERGEVAAAKHREAELSAQSADLAAQVEQEVRSAYADAETAMRQVAFLRDELLPEAQDAYRIASTSYSLGGSSALEVLDAKRVLLDAQSQYADALGAANDAVARLELAVGASPSTPAAGTDHDE